MLRGNDTKLRKYTVLDCFMASKRRFKSENDMCYSRDEEKTIVERFKKEFDVLSKYSKAEIYDQDGNLVKAIIREGGHYREINTIHSHGRTSRTGQTEIQKKQHKAV